MQRWFCIRIANSSPDMYSPVVWRNAGARCVCNSYNDLLKAKRRLRSLVVLHRLSSKGLDAIACPNKVIGLNAIAASPAQASQRDEQANPGRLRIGLTCYYETYPRSTSRAHPVD